jgi:hypothetical protein
MKMHDWQRLDELTVMATGDVGARVGRDADLFVLA